MAVAVAVLVGVAVAVLVAGAVAEGLTDGVDERPAESPSPAAELVAELDAAELTEPVSRALAWVDLSAAPTRNTSATARATNPTAARREEAIDTPTGTRQPTRWSWAETWLCRL